MATLNPQADSVVLATTVNTVSPPAYSVQENVLTLNKRQAAVQATLASPHTAGIALQSDLDPLVFATEAAGVAYQAAEVAAGRPGLRPNQIVVIG